MASNGTAAMPQLPNPFTPMAFFPPELAYQVTISTYILVGSLGVMVWDILDNLPGDFLLLFKYRITVPTVAYFVSRLGSLGYALASTIFETAPTGDCAHFEKGLDWLYPIAIPATSLLFFFRVRAIYDRNIWVVSFFAFMWLATLAGCLTVTQGVIGTTIGPTKYCVNGHLEPYVASAAIISVVNDTLVFIAITWRLVRNSHIELSVTHGFRSAVFGDYMPAISKALLMDGQMYYLTTVTLGLLTLIMLYIPTLSVVYQTMFTVPNIALMNIMACRVFRNTRFGLFREAQISTSHYVSKDDALRHPAGSVTLPIASRSKPKTWNSNDTMELQGIEVTHTVTSQHDIFPEKTGRYRADSDSIA